MTIREFLATYQEVIRWIRQPQWRNWRWVVFGLPLLGGVAFVFGFSTPDDP